MSRALLALFAVASLAVVANCRCVEETCGENEEWNACGSACPMTCAKRKEIVYCTMQCVPQCQCVDGYMRNADGICVREEDCEDDSQGDDCEDEKPDDECLDDEQSEAQDAAKA